MQRSMNVLDIISKKGKEKIVCSTAYTFSVARIADEYCDVLLVGDSVGMTVYGLETTLQVTIDMMIMHGKAVVKARDKSVVVVDMPFASYLTPEKACENAARIVSETGCDAVKLEGGCNVAKTVAALVAHGIPVMGHVGLLPQHFNRLGGYRCQGRTDSSKLAITQDANALETAGAFSVVLECISQDLAADITKELSIPTIGIGASSACDGQILVVDDMIGLSPRCPKFVKEFTNVKDVISSAIKIYADEVREGTFPNDSHCYK